MSRFPDRIAQWEPVLFELHRRHGIHRLLSGALMDRETRGGTSPLLRPLGPSGKGDAGHGHGVWQLDDRSHAAFLLERLPDGRFKWEDPLEAGDYAMRTVLLPALRLFKGDLHFALCAWNAGAGAVKAVLAKAPAHSALAALHRMADGRTAHGDFASDVLFRMGCFAVGMDPYP